MIIFIQVNLIIGIHCMQLNTGKYSTPKRRAALGLGTYLSKLSSPFDMFNIGFFSIHPLYESI
jgi:hypothetical protein